MGAAVAALLAVAGCSSSSRPSPHTTTAAIGCRPTVAKLVTLTQRYLDGVAADTQIPGLVTASPTPSTSASASPSASPVSQQDYVDAITNARAQLPAVGCSQAAFTEAMQSGLQTVRPHGAIAGAVLDQLRAQLRGDFPTTAVTRRAGPHDDLAQVLAELPPKSTLLLAAGTYRLPDTLVLLRSITIRGAGSGKSVLTSATANAAVLVLTDQPVTLSGVALRRTGTAPGSVVVTGPTAAISFRDVAVSGARAASSGGAGGVGVLLTAVGAPFTNRTVTFRAVNSSFSGNDSAGVAAGGTHHVVITGSTFAQNRQCGVCYLGASTGTVSGSTFTSDVVGVVVSSEAPVAIEHNHFQGGDVGIQATGQAKPTVTNNVLKGTARASMVFVGTSAGTVDGNDCSGDRAGIAVARTAYPYVKKNACRVTLG